MITVLLWTLFLAVAEGYGVAGRGSCTHRGQQIPFGVVQSFDNCEYCLCTAGGVVKCERFGDVDCSGFDTDCEAPFVPFGECCPRCHSKSAPEYPTYSGYGSNVANPMAGSVGSKLIRLSPPAYGDGFSTPRTHGKNGGELLNAREVSNALGDTDDHTEWNATHPVPGPEDERGLTCWFWQWGQFIDHDFTLVTEEEAVNAEQFPIHLENTDVFHTEAGASEIHFARANWDRNTGTGPGNWRGHVNSISTAIDASNVYGSDAYSNYLLRDGENRKDGLLRVHGVRQLNGDIVPTLDGEGGELMPLNNGDDGVGLHMANMGGDHFAAGDFRANEQQLLTSMHTLWMREHNRWARKLANDHPGWAGDDEKLFQEARKRVIAEMQIITFDEWLPAVLGTTLQPYGGYQPNIPTTMSTEFVGAFFRFGHTAIRDSYGHYEADNSYDVFTLRDLFFDSTPFFDGHSVAGFARGLSQCRAQAIDVKLVDALRIHLFDGANDLLALNVQRARDMGIGGINKIRESLGLRKHRRFADVTSDAALRAKLEKVYDHVDDCDAWICGMAENKKYGSVGETLGTVLIDQFARLRDGDRFHWQNWLTPAEQAEVENFRLIDLIEHNAVPTIKQDVGANIESLFLTYGNDLFTTGIDDIKCKMVPQSCDDQNKIANFFTYPTPHDNCDHQACLCNLCGPNDAGHADIPVCGSDGKTYDSMCALREAACERTNLVFVHEDSCYKDRLRLEVGPEAEILYPIYPVPPRIRARVPNVSNSKQRWEIHYVTNCGTRARLNPTSSPQAPIPPVAAVTKADCVKGSNECELATRILLGSRVDVADVEFLQTMNCESSQSHLGGLLGSSVLFLPAGETDDFAPEAQCHVVTGSPFVELKATLRGDDSMGGDDEDDEDDDDGKGPRVMFIHISGDMSASGPATVSAELRRAVGKKNALPYGSYSLYLTNERCGTVDDDAWTHYNYGQDGHGATPPLLSINIDANLDGEEKFVGVNPFLNVMGQHTPLYRSIRLIDHTTSKELACGRVRLVEEEDSTDCLIDNTANGGRGQSHYRQWTQDPGFVVNLADGDAQNQGQAASNDSAQMIGGGLTSGTGILVLVALVVVLLIALIFVVIVLYVRSNPYTAPSALKKVGSLAGDPRPSAQVVN